MVYFMENPIKMDDLGIPLFLETPFLEGTKMSGQIIQGTRTGVPRSRTCGLYGIYGLFHLGILGDYDP